MSVYLKIAEVQGKLAESGVAKGRTNTHQKFKFRGIDDLYNALAPLLAKSRLVIIPQVISRDVVERRSGNGGLLSFVTVTVRYVLVDADDDSQTEAIIAGEAMDSSDKATNKAMSAAYKYLCLQTFCIPTEGESADSEQDSHQAAYPDEYQQYATQQPQQRQPRQRQQRGRQITDQELASIGGPATMEECNSIRSALWMKYQNDPASQAAIERVWKDLNSLGDLGNNQ